VDKQSDRWLQHVVWHPTERAATPDTFYKYIQISAGKTLNTTAMKHEIILLTV